MQSTQDASDLALEVIQILEDEKDQIPKPDPQNAGQPGQHGSQKQSDAGNASSSADNAKRQTLEDLLASDGAPQVANLGEQTGAKLQEAAGKAMKDSGGMGAGVGNASAPLVGAGDAAKILQSVHGATTALRTRLRGFVEATKRNRRVHTRRGTRFDGRRVVQGMLGDPRVYQRKITGVAVDTAALILMDRSISMKSRMQVARQSALSCSAALEEIPGVRVSAVAFPGYQAVVDPLTLFGEKVAQTAPRYAGVKASGGTPLLPALLWSVDQLLQQPEKRKLLLVVTDGQPSQLPVCIEAIRRCWLGDIEAMGIGILVPSIADLFPVSTCINDVSELAPAMFGMLQTAITRPKVA
jgi:Mg-chelatase subunit ChlD